MRPRRHPHPTATLTLALGILAFAAAAVLVAPAAAGPPEKVTICHVPPGNPDNAHTIVVGEPAVAAHIDNHGDTLGPCDEDDGGGGDED